MLPPMEEAAELGAEDVMGEMSESEEMLEVGVCTELQLLFPLSLFAGVSTAESD